ncbi:PREDICTED: uncharacterized protein LOC109117173 [Tarenaya hassleriana]|uniref:uncharacterized protein LOC109117173 n=1 Tax=Tarenaya hassleriana TaxID=28532 RepID=UPI0008FCE7E5|nr:PREDICTED: uncharacterized protein LOC109117173 [Tarenaya hassleriana]
MIAVITVRIVHAVDVPQPERHVEGGRAVRDVIHHRLLSRREEYSGAGVWDPTNGVFVPRRVFVDGIFRFRNLIWRCRFAC